MTGGRLGGADLLHDVERTGDARTWVGHGFSDFDADRLVDSVCDQELA